MIDKANVDAFEAELKESIGKMTPWSEQAGTISQPACSARLAILTNPLA